MYYKIVFSPTGGTDAVAEALCRGFGEEFETVDILFDEADMSFGPGDVCIIALPSYGGRIPAVCHERMAGISGGGARAVLVAVFGNRAIDDTLIEMQDLAQQLGFVPVAGIEAVAEHSIFRSFAAGRPDAEDKAELAAFAVCIREKLLAGAESTAMPGTRPYKELKGFMKPSVNANCVRCGVCAADCPAGAIPFSAPDTTDTAECISCLRCVSVCPYKAREIEPETYAAMEKKLAPMLGGRKENKLYI